MIILDTNALRSLGFPSSPTAVLGLLAQSTGHRLGLPETVLREYMSQRRRSLSAKIDTVRGAIAEMAGLAGDWDGRASWNLVAYPDVDAAAEALERYICEAFDVLELTRDAAREALFREADRQAPAQTGERAGGARDASIWLTILEACKTASPAKIIFLSADSDFCKDGMLRPELVTEAPPNLTYCGGLDKVISALADPDDTAQTEAERVFTTENVREAVRRDLTGSAIFVEIMATLRPVMTGIQVRSEGKQIVELNGAPAKVHGFRAGDTLFATADLTWRSERRYAGLDSDWEFGPIVVSFKVRNTVVVAMKPDSSIRTVQVTHRRPIYDVEIL